MEKMQHKAKQSGFTLIEMSIVLVIIGLIVGGVLVGQDLIRAAAVRAQISQIEKFNTAANTFYGKYGYLPGDICDPDASNFGFMARGSWRGQGDGNGLIETNCCGNSTNFSGIYFGQSGENTVFWSDLTYANGKHLNLIEGNFSSPAPFANSPAGLPPVTGTSVSLYLPQAKINSNSHVYVWSGGQSVVIGGGNIIPGDGRNYFGVSSVTSYGDSALARIASSLSLTVAQAYAIDKKMDDGLPQSGNVLAMYLDTNTQYQTPVWAGAGQSTTNGPYTSATLGSSSSCFDNGSVAGQPQQYSVEISNGANVNCALSFKFQ